jgi:hypothetical protein
MYAHATAVWRFTKKDLEYHRLNGKVEDRKLASAEKRFLHRIQACEYQFMHPLLSVQHKAY